MLRRERYTMPTHTRGVLGEPHKTTTPSLGVRYTWSIVRTVAGLTWKEGQTVRRYCDLDTHKGDAPDGGLSDDVWLVVEYKGLTAVDKITRACELKAPLYVVMRLRDGFARPHLGYELTDVER